METDAEVRAVNAPGGADRPRRAAALALIGLLCSVVAAAQTSNPAADPQLLILDDMEDLSPWKSLASDGASASVHGGKGLQGNSVVLEYDLARTAGYTAASRSLAVDLPEDYEFSLWLRGEGGRNHLEIKFVDASGDNVWWYRRPNFSIPGDWQQLRIKKRQIDFAWGPIEDKTLRRVASIEVVIASGADAGKGNVWLDNLGLKTVVRKPPEGPPIARASSEQPGNSAALAIDGHSSTAWRSAAGAASPQSLEIDLRELREFGGLEIDWVKDLHAARYSIETSQDAKQWKTVRTVTAGNGGRDSHLLPESEARWIRVSLPEQGRAFGISEIHVRDLAFGASPNAFIQSLAKHARRGCYPRGFTGEQAYWTILGVDGDVEESLISEDGAIEPRKASFSVEPFIRTSRGVVTWADVSISQSLADNYLPIPSVSWKHRDFELSTTATTMGEKTSSYTHMSYRVRNAKNSRQRLTLALVVRPLQVNPPTQFLNTAGGVSPIQDLAWKQGAVYVDSVPSVVPRTTPRAFRAVPFDADTPCEWLTTTAGATELRDDSGFASGALLFDLDLPARGEREVTLDLPLHASAENKQPQSVAKLPKADPAAQWRAKLNRVEITVPSNAQHWIDTLRTSVAHVLINRDGPAIQPGSRAYERSWIRDGAMTSEMLLRLGHEEVAREFLLWYANFQFRNGKVPCCVDVRGADPVPENDSAGEFLFLISEIYRYTEDKQLLRKLWPNAVAAVGYMEKLRLSERTPENLQGERRALYGLMPASISHEGYAAKPMHSYWDDFWALAGYESAVRIANALEEKTEARRFIAARDEFRSDLYRSLQHAMSQHKIDYLPGAAELGDFDPTSTTIAIAPVGEQQMLPPLALQATFERYWRDVSSRKTSTSWDVYTPYEWRNVVAFTRLGWRQRALELFEFFMNDRRPAAWNQWAEVVGRDPRKPRFIGDMPHGWAASDYMRALLEMFVYERPADDTLVLMAGLPEEWVREDGFSVKNLRTPYGPLSYSLKIEKDRRILEIGALKKLPVGGLVIAWPEAEHPKRQEIQSGQARWLGSEFRVGQLPFRVVFAR